MYRFSNMTSRPNAFQASTALNDKPRKLFAPLAARANAMNMAQLGIGDAKRREQLRVWIEFNDDR